MPESNPMTDAASLLLHTWFHGETIDALPEAMRPATRAEGYAIQAGLETATQSPLYGWKIAATSAAGQRHINVDGPLAGRLFAERNVEDGSTVTLGPNRMRVAEIEFAFTFGRDLPPRDTPYTVDEVLDAVASLHPAIEVPDSRYTDFTIVGAAQIIADNACAHLFLPGPAVAGDWRSVDLAAHPVSATLNGDQVFHGSGANALGDPRLALAWLVNELSGLGITAKAGEMVTTGTCVTPVPITEGDNVSGDWGPFGTLSIRFD
jgi:2-keto-4-pentenoate hydratase